MSDCGWSRRLPVVESSCEYIELAVADSQQGVVKLGSLGRGLKTKMTTWDAETYRPGADYLEGCKLCGLVLGPAVKKHEGRVWTGLIWLGIGTNVEVLWTRSWTSGFQILHRICWPSDEMLPPEVRLCSLKINNVLGILRIRKHCLFPYLLLAEM